MGRPDCLIWSNSRGLLLQGEINRLKSLMGNMQAGRQGGQQGKGKQQGKGIPIGGKRPQGNQQPAGMRAMKKKSMKKRNW